MSRGATAVGVSVFSSRYGKSNDRVGERDVIDAIEQPFQTCHRFCTDRQGIYGGWWSPSCVWALQGFIFLTDVRQYIESSAVREVAPRLSLSPTPGRYLSEVPSGQAHGQAASPELVYIVGHGVCRNFQTPAQTRTSALPRRRIAETEAQEPERILQIQCIQPLEIG